MCNPPLAPKPAKPAQGGRSGRGGAHGGGQRGVWGGGGQGGESSAEAGESSVEAGESSMGGHCTPVESHAEDGCFLQTYDDLGNVVPLLLGTCIDSIPAARMMEIREMERKRDAVGEKVRKTRKNQVGDGEVHVFPPPPPGHEPLSVGPVALGARLVHPELSVLGARIRRPSAKVAECEPQRRRMMAEIRAEAAAKKLVKDPPTKRKADVENEHPRPQKR